MSSNGQELSRLEARVAVLNRVPRTGWLIRGVEQPETVGDHVFGTIILAMLYHDHVTPGTPPTVPMLLVHDLQEISTGDLTHRTKRYVRPYEDFEREHFHNLLPHLPRNARQWFSDIWAEFEAGQTPRARATHIIDVVEMLSQAYEYEKTGQRKLNEFWQWVPRCAPVPALYDLARAIERKRFFLRTGANLQYQHFEATEHHAGREFAQKLKQLDRNEWTNRDEVVKDCLLRRCPRCTKQSLRVLDIGCGTGSFARFFLENDEPRHTVVGVDINVFLLDEAQRRWKHRAFEARQGEIGWYWDFESQSFDLVLIGEVLEHLFDPWFVMREAFRVLRPSGLLLLSVPNRLHKDKNARIVREERIELRYREEHIRYFSPGTVRQLMGETGFQVREMWGLTQQWDRVFELPPTPVLHLDTSAPPPVDSLEPWMSPARSDSEAWTLVVCGTRMTSGEIERIRSVQGPRRQDPVRPLAEWIREHDKTMEWSRIHSFLEEINKAKLLKVDIRDPLTETIAQQTFRVAFLSCCLALSGPQPHPDVAADVAIRCAVLQGVVESHLAEILLPVRAGLGLQTRRRALQDLLSCLSADSVGQYLHFFDRELMSSKIGAIVRSLLRREYERLGATTSGNDYFAVDLVE